MDVEKTPAVLGSETEPYMAVISKSFPKTSERRPVEDRIDDFGIKMNILDTAVPDRSLKLYSLTLAFVIPSTYCPNMLIPHLQDVS